MTKQRKPLKALNVVIALAVTAVLLWQVGTTPREIKLESSEAQKIKDTLARAYSTRALVACNSTADLSLLDAVFVDASDYRLNTTQQAFTTQVFGPPGMKKGFLTLLKTYYLTRRANQTDSSAQGAGRTPRPSVYCPTPSPETRLSYASIALYDRTAVVQYDDGAATAKAILIFLNGQWFVTSIQAIWVHF